jgi:hypothetical protein
MAFENPPFQFIRTGTPAYRRVNLAMAASHRLTRIARVVPGELDDPAFGVPPSRVD